MLLIGVYLWAALVTALGCWSQSSQIEYGAVIEIVGSAIIGLAWPVCLPAMIVRAILVVGSRK